MDWSSEASQSGHGCTDRVRPMTSQPNVIPLMAAVGLLTVMLGATVFGVLLRIEFVQRVDVICQSLERYADGHRQARIPTHPGETEELARLARAMNRVLDRANLLAQEVKSTSEHIAHELRTPLVRLQNRLTGLADMVEGAARVETLLAIDEIAHIQNLAHTILRLSEIEMRRDLNDFHAVDIAALLDDVRDYYQPLAEMRQCTLSIAASSASTLMGDRDLLFQALANLVDNALKYASAGRRIHLAARAGTDWIDLSVIDHGPGIAPDERSVVVERFRRLSNAQGQMGSGLGLPLVKSVAAMHQGELILSDTGPGLTAIIRIKNAAGSEASSRDAA